MTALTGPIWKMRTRRIRKSVCKSPKVKRKRQKRPPLVSNNRLRAVLKGKIRLHITRESTTLTTKRAATGATVRRRKTSTLPHPDKRLIVVITL